MPSTLAAAYERSIAEMLAADGYERTAFGICARTDDGQVWRGLFISFFSKRGTLVTQPHLQVFCPSATRLAQVGLSEVYGTGVKNRSRLGSPMVTVPLYDQVYKVAGQDRHAFSYNIGNTDQIPSACKLMHEDFLSVSDQFFGDITSMRALRDFVVAQFTTTRGAIDAIVLSHLLGEELSSEQIDQYAKLWPCSMTDKFVNSFKKDLDASPLPRG